jgi:hypothetical protein
MTPAPSHLLRFHFVCGAKEVIDLISRPVVGLRGTRVANGRGKKGLSETSRPGLISVMSPDLSQPIHRLGP